MSGSMGCRNRDAEKIFGAGFALCRRDSDVPECRLSQRTRTGCNNAVTWGVPCVTALFVMVAEFRRPSAGAVPRCAALLCLTRVVLLSVGGGLRRSDSSPALLCGAGRFLCRELAPAQVSGHGQRLS